MGESRTAMPGAKMDYLIGRGHAVSEVQAEVHAI